MFEVKARIGWFKAVKDVGHLICYARITRVQIGFNYIDIYRYFAQ